MPAPVKEEGKDIIRKVWYDLKQRGANTSYRSVYRVARSIQEVDPKLANIRLPGERITSDIVSELNKRHGELPKGQREQDEAWSLGSLDRKDLPQIPVQSLPAIKKVWEICILADIPFTVRLAKWVSRLDAWTPGQNPFKLYREASKYSIDEFFYAVIGKPFNTFNNDLFHFEFSKMDTFVMQLLEATGRLPKSDIDDKTLREAGEERSQYLSPWLFALSPLDLVETVHLPTEVYFDLHRKRPSMIEESRKELLEEFGEELKEFSQNAEMAYMIWLPYVAKGPKWNNMSTEERTDIVLLLYSWAASEPWDFECFKYPLEIVFEISPQQRLGLRAISPIEVLQRVGYDVTPTDVQPLLSKLKMED